MLTSHSLRSAGEAGAALKSGTRKERRRSDTIECVLNLRSVRDQFKDAELDLSNDKVAEQMEDLEGRLVDHLADERELRDGGGLLTVAVIGDFNSGKSTFINALLGRKLCPAGDEPTTASVTHFIHGDKERVWLEREGTRLSITKAKYMSLVSHKKVGDRKADTFYMSVDSRVLEHIRLVDTPGFNAPPPNTNDTKVTEGAVAAADVLFVVTDARKGNPSRTLLEQLDRLQNTLSTESGPIAFLLLNKAELLPPSQRNEVRTVCKEQYGERFRNVTSVSARLLNDVDDGVPLGALDTTTRRIRSALSRRESFAAKISAKIVNKHGQQNYRIDIDGSEYEASASSDVDLASRDQLATMVESVASERHILLERKFRRKTSQLRRDWLKVVSSLDGLCRPSAMAPSGVGDATDGRKQEALKAIDDATDQILELALTMFHEVGEAAVSKGSTEKPGFLSYKILYHVDVFMDRAYGVMEDHENWRRVKMIVTNLTNTLKLMSDGGTTRSHDRFSAELRDHGLEIVRDSLEEDCRVWEKSAEWKREGTTHWRRTYENKEVLMRDTKYDSLLLAYRLDAARWTLLFSRYFLRTIDRLQETIIRYDEKGHAEVREREDELTKLRERIDELKEYTP